MRVSVSKRRLFAPALLLVVLLAIELMDELVGSTREAALPLIRDALNLDYRQIGLLLGLPMFVSSVLEPAMYFYADMGNHKRIIVLGGILFMLSVAGYAFSLSFPALLLVVLVFYPASGMFVSLSQAVLMDNEPHRREQNMARWTLAGSVGVVAGPLLLSAGLTIGADWRAIFILLAALTLPLILLVAKIPFPAHISDEDDDEERPSSLWESARSALAALKDGEVRRWLLLLEFANLMMDILLSYLALYMVDVVGLDEGQAALAVAVWTGVGLIGDALLIPLLERVDGISYLRVSAVIEFALFALFLLVPSFLLKLVLLGLLGFFNAGWYAILQARLYGTLEGRSGAVLALTSLMTILGGALPFGIGLVAERLGLNTAMWLMLAGPVALMIGLRGVPKNETN